MTFPPPLEALQTESDVEQKFLWPLLSLPKPFGWAVPQDCIFTKRDIRKFQIEKGNAGRLYFPDYVVSIIGIPVAIVEVKAPSVTDLAEAAREARLYATELNACYPSGLNPCRYCLVSNGVDTQLRMWDSDEVIATFGLSEASITFIGFTAAASHCDGNALRRHAVAVHQKRRPARYRRPVDMVGGHSVQDERIEYNNFGKLLTSRFQNLFNPNTWEDRRRIVREAYVPSRRRERYVAEIDRVIEASVPPALKQAQLLNDSSHPVEITDRLRNPQELRNKILLLIGAVGAGKSTFVDYLQEVGLPPEVRSTTAWVRLDLNEAPVSTGEIYSWCRERLASGIRQTAPEVDVTSVDGLCKLYRSQVRGFEEGEGSLFSKASNEFKTRLADLLTALKNDASATLKALEYCLCTSRGRLLIVGLDNCDKRNRDEQLLMFQVAKWIQQEVRCLIILPLRQETFDNHRQEPPLDTALKDLVFRIGAPPFQEVLAQRLKLVVAAAKGAEAKSLRYHMGQAEVEFPAEKLERFLRLMMGSLMEHEHYGRKIVIGLAGWDIRRALEIFLEFCRSGYITEGDIFQVQATGQHQFLQPATIARMLLRTDRRYYQGDYSYIKNLFQCRPSSDNPDHFLRFSILTWLRERTDKHGPSGIRGYHRLGDLVQSLAAYGCDGEAVREECRYLLKARCILSEHLRTEELHDGDLIALTPAGHVHLDLAKKDIHYLAACAEDCWLADAPLAEQIRRRVTLQPWHNALSWGVTLDTAGDFVKYLSDQQDRSLAAQGHHLEPVQRITPIQNLREVQDRIAEEQRRWQARRQGKNHQRSRFD